MTYPNRYKGNCKTCGIFVAAGEGIYEQGLITCTDTVGVNQGAYVSWLCVPAYNKLRNTDFTTWCEAARHQNAIAEELVAQTQEQVRMELVNGKLVEMAQKANVRSLAQVIAKVTGAERELATLTFSQATAVRAELRKRIERKTATKILDEFKKSDTCNRCGGAGGADKWKHTGTVCYKCGGSGKYHN